MKIIKSLLFALYTLAMPSAVLSQDSVRAQETPTEKEVLHEVEIKLTVRTSTLTPEKTKIKLIGFPASNDIRIEQVQTIISDALVVKLNEKGQPVVGLNDQQLEVLNAFFESGGSLVSYKIVP